MCIRQQQQQHRAPAERHRAELRLHVLRTHGPSHVTQHLQQQQACRLATCDKTQAAADAYHCKSGKKLLRMPLTKQLVT